MFETFNFPAAAPAAPLPLGIDGTAPLNFEVVPAAPVAPTSAEPAFDTLTGRASIRSFNCKASTVAGAEPKTWAIVGKLTLTGPDGKGKIPVPVHGRVVLDGKSYTWNGEHFATLTLAKAAVAQHAWEAVRARLTVELETLAEYEARTSGAPAPEAAKAAPAGLPERLHLNASILLAIARERAPEAAGVLAEVEEDLRALGVQIQ